MRRLLERGSTGEKGRVSPVGMKFLAALVDALAGDTEITHVSGRRATSVAAWRSECERIGLIDPKQKPDSARTLFNKHRRELIGANRVVCNGETVWTI